MFDYIKGVLSDKSYPYCTVECNGIGYRLLVNLRTLNSLDDINSEVKIYTKLIHKEDSMTLCGFKNKQERVIFEILAPNRTSYRKSDCVSFCRSTWDFSNRVYEPL